MRLLIWNIRYGAGAGIRFHLPVPGAGYLRPNRSNLRRIIDFIRSTDADVVGLLEVDGGSFRSRVDQPALIAEAIGHYSTYECKYGTGSVNSMIPILRHQGNAFLAAPRVHGERFHYFRQGVKRLVIELELDDVAIFLVHLSLGHTHRVAQLEHLESIVRNCTKPVIVAGDFNTFRGDGELEALKSGARLLSANLEGVPTFPSHKPRRELDFILHDESIAIDRFEVPDVRLSDHLPVLCDFRLK